MIEIQNISKSFGAKNAAFALQNINLKIDRYETTCIAGPNGSGKTTLLKIVAGLIISNSGTVSINNSNILRESANLKKIIGFCANDERSFYGRLSVKENLKFFGSLYALNGRALNQRVDELSAIFELSGCLNLPYQKCSSGFKQRASLARAFLHDPELLLIDELNKSIDPEFCGKIFSAISGFASKKQKTVVFSAHNLAELDNYSGRLILLNKGLVAGDVKSCLGMNILHIYRTALSKNQ